MSFYGNIRENISKSQFQFDRIYANRFSMDAAIGASSNSEKVTDGVFVGRFVLVDYNLDPGAANPSGELAQVESKVEPNYYSLIRTNGGQPYCVEDFADLPADGFYVVITNEKLEDNQYYIVYYYFYKNQERLRTGSEVDTGEKDESGNPIIKHKALFSRNKFVKYQTDEEISDDSEEAAKEAFRIESNAQIDRDCYGGEYNATVWQKIITDDKEEYILVARLNSDMPALTGWVLGPGESPVIRKSSSTNYFIGYPDAWKVEGEISSSAGDYNIDAEHRLTNNQISEIGGDSVSVTTKKNPNAVYYEANGQERNPQPDSILAFAFSLPGFKIILNNFWDLIHGGANTNNSTRLTNLKFYGDKVDLDENNKGISVDDLTEEQWATLGKQFDLTTVGGMINFLQLYLGKGIVRTGVKADDNFTQEELKTLYDNNYIIPSKTISTVGIDTLKGTDLKYIKKVTNFQPINTPGSGFTVEDDVITQINKDNPYIYIKNTDDDYHDEYDGRIATVGMSAKPSDSDDYYYYVAGYSYELADLLDGDSLLELLIKLYQKFNFDDKQSRDVNTVMGLFNLLEDQIQSMSQRFRNDIKWDVSDKGDASIMTKVFGSIAVNERRNINPSYFYLDEVVDYLGETYQSHVLSHLIKSVENKENEMSARLVFSPRRTEEEASDVSFTEAQGIVYDGSKHKTSAIRFLDNPVEQDYALVTAENLQSLTDGNYYIKKDDGTYQKVNEFEFDVSSLGNNIYAIDNSVQEAEFDVNYDYYYLSSSQELYVGNPANNPGNGLSLGAGGLTILGAGESPSLFEKYVINNPLDTQNVLYPNTEELILSSDNNIRFYTNLNEYRAEWDNYYSDTNNNKIEVLEALREFYSIYLKMSDAREQLALWHEEVDEVNSLMREYILYWGYRRTEEAFENHWKTITGSTDNVSNINGKFPLVVTKENQSYNVWDPNDPRIVTEGDIKYIPNDIYLERVKKLGKDEKLSFDNYYYYLKNSNGTYSFIVNTIPNESSQETVTPEGSSDTYYKNIYQLEKNPEFQCVKLTNGNVVTVTKEDFSHISGLEQNEIQERLNSVAYSEDVSLYFEEISEFNQNTSNFIYFEKNTETNRLLPRTYNLSDFIINNNNNLSSAYLRGFLRYQASLNPPEVKPNTYYKLKNDISLKDSILASKKIDVYNNTKKFGYDEATNLFKIDSSIINSNSEAFPPRTNETFIKGAFIGKPNNNSNFYYLILTQENFNTYSDVRKITWNLNVPDIEKYRVLTIDKDGLKVKDSLVPRIMWGPDAPNSDTGQIGDLYIQLN